MAAMVLDMSSDRSNKAFSTHKKISPAPTTVSSYEPPRVVQGRRLTEVTGQVAPVPSGAPAPRDA
jgi:hypothetical protein